MWVEAALWVAALVLVLMGLAPVASNAPRTALRTRIARQIHLWDRYLYHDPRIWYPRE